MNMLIRSKKWLAVGMMGAAIGLLSSVSVQAFERIDGDKYLVIAGRQPADILDPALKQDQSTRMMHEAMYDSLVRFTGKPARITPWLAKSWEVSDGGKEWIFHLDDRAVFHNGEPVNATVIRDSFIRILELEKGPAWMFKDFLSADTIEVIDDATIKFTLSTPYVAFLSLLPSWYIVNVKQAMAHEVNGDKGQAWLNTADAGSGPFKLAKVEPGNFIKLDAIKDYWKGWEQEEPLGGFIYKLIRESSGQRAALTRGEADIILSASVEDVEILRSQKGVKIAASVAASESFAFQFNMHNEHTSDINIRKAIAYALDYEGLLQIFNGNATLQTSPFGSGVKGHIDVANVPRQDLAKAKEYLAKSAWPDGGFELEYVYVQGYEIERQMGLLLIDNLGKIGIKVNIVPLTWPNMVARASTKDTSPDMIAIFKGPVTNDPDLVAYMYHKDSWGQYYGSSFIDNDELNALIDKGRSIADWDKRAPIYAEIQNKIVDIQPEIFGMMSNKTFVMRDYVQGFQDSAIRMGQEVDVYPMYIGK